MSTSPPLFLILAAGPGAAGGAHLLDRAAREPGPLRVILTGGGLDWAATDRLADLSRAPDARIALCSQSARERGLSAESLPGWIEWSSLLQWLLDRRPGAPLWTCLP